MVTGGAGLELAQQFCPLYRSRPTINLMMSEFVRINICPGVDFLISIDELCDVTSVAHGVVRSVITKETIFYDESTADTDS